MFKNFPGYRLLEKIQKNKSHKRQRKLPLNAIKLIFIVAITAIIALMDTESFGIDGLTVVHQRIIALFVFAALMWLTETLPSWVTSMIVVTVMLLTVSTSAVSTLRTEKTTKSEALTKAYDKYSKELKSVKVEKSKALAIINKMNAEERYNAACIKLEELNSVEDADITNATFECEFAKSEFDNACEALNSLNLKEDIDTTKVKENFDKALDKYNVVSEKLKRVEVQQKLYSAEKKADPKKEEKAFTPYVPFKDILGCFANPTIMLFIGGFVLAIGLTKVKLDVALARVLLKPFGTNSNVVLLGFILVTAIFSAFVSNTATAAMMLAFLTPVLKSLPADGKGRIALALAIPVGANLGGMITPIGTPPNMIALDYLSSQGMGISFVDWTIRMAPFVIILLVIAWMLLRFMFPFKQKQIKIEIEGDIKWNYQTWAVIVAFAVTIFMWMFGTDLWGVDTNVVAMIPIAIFCATGILTRRDLEEINWSVLWMVAGGFALGVALNYKVTDPDTGVVIYNSLSNIVVNSVPFDNFSPLMVMILAGLICFAFSNFISHSAATSLLVPVLGVVAGGLGTALDGFGGPQAMLVGIAIASSVSMILPISTPPNAIAHSTGFIQQKDMMKVGILIGLIGLVLGYGMLIFIGF
ncbi:MAG: DASS family sodium-coupled anion symporter [Bacteroidaceae bacterium]|nr:DASS family sodium-coupled anion symporter [Bacteroidaceae bacterium]